MAMVWTLVASPTIHNGATLKNYFPRHIHGQHWHWSSFCFSRRHSNNWTDCYPRLYVNVTIPRPCQLQCSQTQPDGSFTGFKNETSGIIHFLGVRFADAPVGNLRWRAPVSPPSTHLGNVNAKKKAKACIPTSQTVKAHRTSEDCLFGNVTICYFVPYLLVLETSFNRYSFLWILLSTADFQFWFGFMVRPMLHFF